MEPRLWSDVFSPRFRQECQALQPETVPQADFNRSQATSRLKRLASCSSELNFSRRDNRCQTFPQVSRSFQFQQTACGTPRASSAILMIKTGFGSLNELSSDLFRPCWNIVRC